MPCFPDDVQKFEKAIVSGKPFKTGNTSRRLSKGSGDDAHDANDSSGYGSESAHEPPKMVSRNLVFALSILIPSQNNARRSIMAFLQDQSSDNE
jgi:hypothetical protein